MVKEYDSTAFWIVFSCPYVKPIEKLSFSAGCYVWCAGNYYSLRTQHEKAVLYFQRALKLNPNYLAAWTLMGHEYMELKHTSAAIQAYRQAIGQYAVLCDNTYYPG